MEIGIRKRISTSGRAIEVTMQKKVEGTEEMLEPLLPAHTNLRTLLMQTWIALI